MKQIDFPLIEVEETAKDVIAKGGFIYQKWTCAGCGERVTGNVKNALFIKGHHEECGHVTDLLVTGCNYVAFMPANARSVQQSTETKQ